MQDRVLVALPLVGFLVTSVGAALTSIGVPVASIALPVASIGLPVASISPTVTPVSRQVPLPAGIADVGGVVALAGSLVARIAGPPPLPSGIVAPVRSPLAPLCGLQTLLRRQRAVDSLLQFLPGEGGPLAGTPRSPHQG